MTTSIEQQVVALEQELKAQKEAFEKSAVSMPVFTKTKSFQTTENKLRYKANIYGQEMEWEQTSTERFAVIFTTSRGSNTIAKLELASDRNVDSMPIIHRVYYPGGAKWIVSGYPYVEYSGGTAQWKTTTYDICVHSMVDGTLSVEEIVS